MFAMTCYYQVAGRAGSRQKVGEVETALVEHTKRYSDHEFMSLNSRDEVGEQCSVFDVGRVAQTDRLVR